MERCGGLPEVREGVGNCDPEVCSDVIRTSAEFPLSGGDSCKETVHWAPIPELDVVASQVPWRHLHEFVQGMRSGW